VIFGEGGRGDTDSGTGVVGNGEMIGVNIDRRGDGGSGDNGGDDGENKDGLKDLVRSNRAGPGVVAIVVIP
jgi:hypothetical protein